MGGARRSPVDDGARKEGQRRELRRARACCEVDGVRKRWTARRLGSYCKASGMRWEGSRGGGTSWEKRPRHSNWKRSEPRSADHTQPSRKAARQELVHRSSFLRRKVRLLLPMRVRRSPLLRRMVAVADYSLLAKQRSAETVLMVMLIRKDWAKPASTLLWNEVSERSRCCSRTRGDSRDGAACPASCQQMFPVTIQLKRAKSTRQRRGRSPRGAGLESWR